ncbi:MAG TPA: hypothetical protein VFZ61_07685 [Polyangiales bacterium]
MSLPFNRVELRDRTGVLVSTLSVSQFSAMPLTDRVRAVLERRVLFFRDDQPIEMSDALRALRQAGA